MFSCASSNLLLLYVGAILWSGPRVTVMVSVVEGHRF
jgi:hypothetical protein